jgi:MFS family permease
MAATRGGGLFHRYWASVFVSYLGDGIRLTAFPLLAVSLTTDPTRVAAVSAAATLPWLLFGLHAGVLVDRLPRLRLMVVLQLIRAAAGAVAVAGVVSGRLNVWELAVIAGILGTCEVGYDMAGQAILPEVVPAERLPWANSRLVSTEAVVLEFAGPALGGVLFAVAASLPVAVDTVTFLGSAALLASMAVKSAARITDRTPTVAVAAEPVWAQLKDGVRWFLGSPLIRSITVVTTCINLGSGGLEAVLALFARDHLGLGPAGYGLLIAVGAIGSFTGGLVAERVVTARARRTVILWTAPVNGACFILIGLFPDRVVTFAMFVAFGVTISVFRVHASSLRQARVPAEMLGRVLGVHRVVCWGALPVGALGAGVIGSAFGIRWAIIAAGATVVLSWLVLIRFLSRPGADQYVIEESHADEEVVASA